MEDIRDESGGLPLLFSKTLAARMIRGVSSTNHDVFGMPTPTITRDRKNYSNSQDTTLLLVHAFEAIHISPSTMQKDTTMI